MTESLCIAPWNVYTVNANGTVGLCCINSEVFAKTHANLKSEGLLDSVKDDMLNGRPVAGCEKCYELDAAGAKSLRQIYNGLHRRAEAKLDETGILWFDLSMGNKCNHACRMCGPHNSTGWLKDLQGFKDIYWAHVNNVITYQRHSDNGDKIPEIIEQMKLTKDAFAVELKGGEPLYIDANRTLLREMIQSGLHEKCRELRIMTNGTAVDDTVFDLLKAFENVNLAISIDAVGTLHSYTRGTRLSWDECRRCWQKLINLPNVTELRISNTIYAYTVFHLNQLYDFVRSEFGNTVVIANALLHRPLYLSVATLPKTLRDQAREVLPDNNPVISLLAAPDEPDRGIRENRFRLFTKKLDKMRGENVLDHVPQLASLMNPDDRHYDVFSSDSAQRSLWASYKNETDSK